MESSNPYLCVRGIESSSFFQLSCTWVIPAQTLKFWEGIISPCSALFLTNLHRSQIFQETLKFLQEARIVLSNIFTYYFYHKVRENSGCSFKTRSLQSTPKKNCTLLNTLIQWTLKGITWLRITLLLSFSALTVWQSCDYGKISSPFRCRLPSSEAVFSDGTHQILYIKETLGRLTKQTVKVIDFKWIGWLSD